jgi:calcineurin-like phosphoesterase family protein
LNFYITSDQHFFHQNIIKYSKRPFTFDFNGVIEMITHIGNNYNSIIQDDDLVFHLGDLACGPIKTYKNLGYILENLKGRKILIKGNHDKWEDKYYLNYFESVQRYLIFDDYFFCHYPCYNKPYVKLSKKESVLLKILLSTQCTKIIHGHIHNKDPKLWESDGYIRTNVSVDFK